MKYKTKETFRVKREWRSGLFYTMTNAKILYAGKMAMGGGGGVAFKINFSTEQ